MEFMPLYYKDKIRQIDHTNQKFEKDKINIINPKGTAGVLTLWSEPLSIWQKLLEKNPSLFKPDSPLVTLTSLYGNGLPQLLANLAYNPQIQYLAVTGNDTPAVPSWSYLSKFLEKGVELPKEEGQQGKIKGTTFPIDQQLNPELFLHLRTERFKPSDLESLIEFISKSPTNNPKEEQRKKIELVEPEFSDFPSDIASHSIYAETPITAWTEVMYRLDRFGKNIQLKKGVRRVLFNLDVHIANPSSESEELLRKFNFDSKELWAYKKDMLKGELPENTTYSYGNRLRQYFGIDALDEVIKRLKADPLDRRCFISTWNTAKDLSAETSSDSSVPCLTDIYFVNLEGKLMLTSSFRTHNAVSAWLLNLYGLRAIQEYVAEKTNLQPGKINVKSRWIGIDPEEAKTNSALELIKKQRRIGINVNDPRGYFIVEARSGEIITEHYSPEAQKLTTYSGKTAKDIKDQLRQNSTISDPDHAIWLGYELAKAHLEIHKELPEL